MSQAFRQQSRSLKVWDGPTRLFHWTLVVVIAAAFVSAEEDSPLSDWHQPAGWTAAILVVFRIVWGMVGGEHSRFADFLAPKRIAGHVRAMLAGRAQSDVGHNPLGAVAVVALLALVAGSAATGALIVAGRSGDDLHEAVANSLLGMIALHVSAVTVMSLMSRDTLVRAMVTGRKKAALHAGVRDARPAPAYALPLAALCMAAAAYGATLVDPQAFTPHQRAEASGHERGESVDIAGHEVEDDDD